MDFEHLTNWFRNFKEFSTSLYQQRLEWDLKAFNKLLTAFLPIQSRIKIQRSKLAPDYNIFYIIKNISQKEDETHSPFLADLLNVHGKHEQHRLFYDEFIKQFNSMKLKSKFDFDEELFFSVSTEKDTGDGRIDIFIQYISPRKRFAIAIENKIFAKDQPNQLKKYSGYLRGAFDNNFLLLYLTLDGRRPSMPYSIGQKEYESLEKEELIKSISYRKHIVSLLESTFPEIKSEKITIITKQYLELLKNDFRNG